MLTKNKQPELLRQTDAFVKRHIGPSLKDREEMLRTIGASSLSNLIDQTIPSAIRVKKPINLGEAQSEFEILAKLRATASQNRIFKSYIGMGYYDSIMPAVIQRNILENPGWYTQYTPYQAEIAQGRLEALLNFQTMVMDMTAMEIANASLLDEGTAAAEAMSMCYAIKSRPEGQVFFISEQCHPQTISVMRTRAESTGIRIVVGNHERWDWSQPCFGALLQYPATDGSLYDYRKFIEKAHASNALVVLAADLLSLAIFEAPGELGADVAVGSTQRFGLPIAFGGPHAGYLATRDEYKRLMSGRIIGVSQDANGKPAIRLALQTREQHIRRDKATSNICTAQVLLAILSSMYAVYHGPQGIKRIAQRVNYLTRVLAAALTRMGFTLGKHPFFDTVRVELDERQANEIMANAQAAQINLRRLSAGVITVSLDETVSVEELTRLIRVFKAPSFSIEQIAAEVPEEVAGPLARKSAYLRHPVFNSYHSETEMLRYIRRLESKDLSLTGSMIPLGSCTMKLNAAAEMLPITWPEFARVHPFVPAEQARGYRTLFSELEGMLAEITGFAGVSLQPNAGSQGEYSGLLVIRKYHEQRGQSHRDICLIPKSAHGTNPASAVMAGMKVVVVECDSQGNIDVADLRSKAEAHKDNLAALMVTYPSTHGVFEEAIVEICDIVHRNGGQVYMDGANMNAQVGLCRPGDFGPDVCHLNLHKTFSIPHGGGGPGVGPIAVAAHLKPFLPTHPVVQVGRSETGIGPVAAAPWGSASILPISYSYIAMMGADGLRQATEVAILNANYIARRLEQHYPVLYKGSKGRVAHECILDCRPIKAATGIEVDDIAKRLMDYGFHAPTVSFPVPGTIMVEPTESESKAELDRFCDAMIEIRAEIAEIEAGKADRTNNLLKNAPHPVETVIADKWDRPYSRERAAFPLKWVHGRKFWPAVARINNVLGDRNLICSCPSIESYQ